MGKEVPMSIIGAVNSGYGAYSAGGYSPAADTDSKPILNPNGSTQRAPGKL